MKTFSYSQPEAYHFSLDSVEMAEAVAEHWRSRGKTPRKVLDLCAGSGVIGFDFSLQVPGVFDLDFVEVQQIYQEHFERNQARFLELKNAGRPAQDPLSFSSGRVRFFRQNMKDFLSSQNKETYDLILCNPPYFETSQGPLPADEFKSRCRFFVDSEFEDLWASIEHLLAPGGEAYVLVREEQKAWKRFRYAARVETFANIRGTFLSKISK